MLGRPRWVSRVFSREDLDAVVAAVDRAESRTAGEIRVHIERRVARGRRDRTDAMTRARDVFAQLKMHETALRAGVLIYLALEDHQLAIVGDDGIHTRVGDAYWAGIRDRMVDRLRGGATREAIVQAVEEVGAVLAREFPRRPDDIDELTDEVSLGP
jgi:uncharacterized membrane protein